MMFLSRRSRDVHIYQPLTVILGVFQVLHFSGALGFVDFHDYSNTFRIIREY